MIVDPGSLVYRGSLTATHTARAVAGPNGYTRVVSIDTQGLAVHRGDVTRTMGKDAENKPIGGEPTAALTCGKETAIGDTQNRPVRIRPPVLTRQWRGQ